MNIPILFENKAIVVINKPLGIIVHPDERGDEYTLSQWMKEKYELYQAGEEGREGVVHRLDRNTSGVLVLVKTREGFSSMKRQFQDHSLRKVYRAIVEGHIRHETGMISAPLARAKSDFRKKTIVDPFSKDNRGEEREAITRYKVLAKGTGEDGKHYTYVECYPLTGRTHQIRAHFRGIRHPIVGDDLYGSRSGKEVAPRSMLHAYSLTFVVPGEEQEEKKTIVAPVPDDMKEVLKKLNFPITE